MGGLRVLVLYFASMYNGKVCKFTKLSPLGFAQGVAPSPLIPLLCLPLAGLEHGRKASAIVSATYHVFVRKGYRCVYGRNYFDQRRLCE